MTRTISLFLSTVTLSGLLAACNESSAPGTGAQVSFNIATQGSASAATRPAGAPDTLVDSGGNVLVLTKVEIVLRDVEFERQNHDDCDSLSQGGDDGCEQFQAGPVLIDLPLNGQVDHEFTASIDSGTFDELKLKIHKPEDNGNAADQVFLAAHPDLVDASIRVHGSFNGTSFIFTSDLGAEQEFLLNPPIVISGAADVGITLKVDISGWFVSGVALVNPGLALKGGAFESVVEGNIRASFEAFHDDDRDGHDDE